MNKKLWIIAVALTLAVTGIVFAQTPNSGNDFQIKQLSNGTLAITKYTGTRKDVVIPSTIEGIKVTVIGGSKYSNEPGAFEKNQNITSVTIPNSITSIGDSAFDSCVNLTSVTIPASVTSIGGWAFLECTGLTSITIPASVTSIGEGAFVHCTSLTSITIPNGVTSIGDVAFAGCTSLTSITIPNSVKTIEGVFINCSNITSITIGANKDYAYAFPNNFDAYYISQGKKAGTYTWSGRLWSVK